jgi:hypothetical protein
MAEEESLQTRETLIATLEREHEGSVIKFDEHGQPVGIEEQTTKQEALTFGVVFTLVGSVFFFFPLSMMLLLLQDGFVEMLCIVPFFGIFLLVGGIMLAGGLKTLFSGITGKGLTYVVTLEELAERKNEEDASDDPPEFSFTSREALLSQLHQTESPEPDQSTSQDEASAQPSGGFWDIENSESSTD